MNILITGGTSGIGKRLADSLTARGHQVVTAGRRDGADLVMDVADQVSVRRAFEALTEKSAVPEVVVHAAGIQGEIAAIHRAESLAWWETVEVNLLGTFNVLQTYLQTQPGSRRFIAFSGGGATGARPNFSAYGVAKAAVVRLIEMAHAEARDEGRNEDCFFAIAPGALPTAMTEEVVRLGPTTVGEKEYQAARKLLEAGSLNFERAIEGLVRLVEDPDVPVLSGRLIALQWDDISSTLNALRANPEGTRDVWHLRRVNPAWSQRG